MGLSENDILRMARIRLRVHVLIKKYIFARILFSRIALKGIFAMLKISDLGMIYLPVNRMISTLREGFVFTKLRIFASAKFRENKILAKISEFTVCFAEIVLVAVGHGRPLI